MNDKERHALEMARAAMVGFLGDEGGPALSDEEIAENEELWLDEMRRAVNEIDEILKP